MAAPDRQQSPPSKRTQQHVQNWSFDEAYKVLSFLPLGEYNNALYRLQVDSSGNLKIAPAKATEAYAISNIEDTGTYKYFGFEDADGAWYIMRKTLSDSTFLYAKGASNYSTAWTNRASQSYASYGSTF